MKKTKLFSIIGTMILSSVLLIGCNTLDKKEDVTLELSYSDLVDENINKLQEDTYSSGTNDTMGEYSSAVGSIDETAMGTLDYDSLTEEEIKELLNKNMESNQETGENFVEFNKAQSMARSSDVTNIKDDDLNLYVTYLLLNVFSNDYVVDTTLNTEQIKQTMGIEEDKYIDAFVQSKSDDNSSFFGMFKVGSKEEKEYLINHLTSYANSYANDPLMANSIIAQKECKKQGEITYIVLFISFDLSNREEPLEIPEGYALVEEFEDGTYIMETEDDYGNINQTTGYRVTMNMNYRELIVNKLTRNNYEIIK